MKLPSPRLLLPLICINLACAAAPAQDAPASRGAFEVLEGFDVFVNNVLRDFEVPGLAVAIINNGEVILSKGYGFRDVKNKLPVTADTLFAIGSVTKSFTAAGLGILADEGKLDWDAPVQNYVSDFRLQDPVATQQMTPRDLVTHRSGLPRHDFMWYTSPQLSRAELFRRLRFLAPNKPFRADWQYQNLMFMTAGIVAERITGKSWEAFTRERVLDPIGMAQSNFSPLDSQKTSDYALPYHKGAAGLKEVPFYVTEGCGPAGTINSNVNEMIRYVLFHVNKGKAGGKQILSAAQAEQMQTPQMVMPMPVVYEELDHASYGMGFMITNYRGAKCVEHGGGIDGFISLLGFLPRKKIGVIVLTNSTGDNPVPALVARNIYDRCLRLPPVDWAARAREQLAKRNASEDDAKKKAPRMRENAPPTHPLAEYAGAYEHPGYGALRVEHKDSKLYLIFAGGKSVDLRHFHYDIFETQDSSNEDFDRIKVSFYYNKRGEIDRLEIPLEPSVADIAFKRAGDPEMRSRAFLDPLAGAYEIGGREIAVALRSDGVLLLTIPGQPTYELSPARGLVFDVNNLPGYSVEFKKDAAGAACELIFNQPNGEFAAKRKH